MTNSEQLERETEQTRARISTTLDELRARMTPGQVIDQLLDYANESSGGAFVGNLRQQVVNNPLPVALMGAGIAWLAMSSRRGPANGRSSATTRYNNGAGDMMAGASDWAADIGSSGQHATEQWADRARATAHDTTQRMADTASEMGDAARGTAASASAAASDAYNSAAETASRAYDSASEGLSQTYGAAADQVRRAGDSIKQTAASASRNLSGVQQSLQSLFRDQPLVLAGLGVAIGALIGAALPSSEAEDELMGESSDSVKRDVAEFAEQKMEKGKSALEQAWESAKGESQKAGLGASSADTQVSGSADERESADSRSADANVEHHEAPLVPSVGDDERRKLEPSGAE